MGIESTSACNRLNAIALAEKGESGFRTSSVLMIFGVSHAQRPPRQRLSSNEVIGNFDPPKPPNLPQSPGGLNSARPPDETQTEYE